MGLRDNAKHERRSYAARCAIATQRLGNVTDAKCSIRAVRRRSLLSLHTVQIGKRDESSRNGRIRVGVQQARIAVGRRM